MDYYVGKVRYMKKNRGKRLFGLMVACLLAANLLIGCGQQTEENTSSEMSMSEIDSEAAAGTSTEEPKTQADETLSGSIDVAVTYTDTNLEKFEEIVNGFEEETGVTVELISSADYESTLKTMMASNTLPDVFMTHGWSLRRPFAKRR